MALASPAKSKINTEATQLISNQMAQRGRLVGKAARSTRSSVRMAGDARESARDPGRVVVEVGCGIVVYPPEGAGMPWRAVLTENGRRRYRQAMTEAELAAKPERVKERLAAGAPITWTLTGCRPGSGGPAVTPTPRAGCAAGSPSRSSPR
jgi:hypothetical protein